MSLAERGWYRREVARKQRGHTRAPLYGRRRPPRWSTARTVALIVGLIIVLGFALMHAPVREWVLASRDDDGWQPGYICPEGSHAIKREIGLTGVLESTCLED